jgi:hypothetical protein
LREWLGLDGQPEGLAIRFRDPNYPGLLHQLADDVRMCKILMGLPNGPGWIRDTCHLTSEQLRAACAIGFLSYLPEATKGDAPCMTDEYRDLLGLTTLNFADAWERVWTILNAYHNEAQRRLRFEVLPESHPMMKEFLAENKQYFVLFIEEASCRTVVLGSNDAEHLRKIGILGAMFGFDDEQINYMLDCKLGLPDLMVAKERPDIWRQFVLAHCCHALGRLPELKTRESWVLDPK